MWGEGERERSATQRVPQRFLLLDAASKTTAVFRRYLLLRFPPVTLHVQSFWSTRTRPSQASGCVAAASRRQHWRPSYSRCKIATLACNHSAFPAMASAKALVRAGTEAEYAANDSVCGI